MFGLENQHKGLAVACSQFQLNQYPRRSHSRDKLTHVTDAAGTVLNPWKFSSEYHDSETGLVYYNYRDYAPSLGRWISRDPIEEDGGINIYNICCSAIRYFDNLGLAWTVNRSGLPWACAERDNISSDTIPLLAELIGLDPMEKLEWLRNSDGSQVTEIDMQTKQCFKVPNTVVVYTAQKNQLGDYLLITVIPRLKSWAENIGKAYQERGYYLIEVLEANSIDKFIELWETNGLAAFFFAGHGTTAGFEPAPGLAVSAWDVSIKYKLQAIGALSCFSSYPVAGGITTDNVQLTKSWNDLVSSNGAFIGFNGAANVYNWPFVQVVPRRRLFIPVSHPKKNPGSCI